MPDEKLSYIQDVSQEKLFYHFTPAAISSNFIPLLVVLDFQTRPQVTDFEYKMWNILTPIINFENDNKDLLQILTDKIADEYECEDHIYVYGSYDAVLHIALSKVNTVHAYTKQIKKLGNESRNLKNVLDFFERVASEA